MVKEIHIDIYIEFLGIIYLEALYFHNCIDIVNTTWHNSIEVILCQKHIFK